MKTFIALTTFLALVVADQKAPYHPSPAPYHPAPSYNEVPAAYQYPIKDDYSGVNFGADEARDGYATKGSYTLALPDGRLQTVSYSIANAYSGFVADVSYSGESKYAPYKPAPVYHA
nr:cuticle protein 19-like [Lepeophtheirus salmonis]